jgi:riboflavin biosynthesis pyrimidine reductase
VNLRRVFPVGGDTVETDSVETDAPDVRERVTAWYRPPHEEWLRLNLITTVSGSATGSDGTSESITNPTDRVILNVIRSLADVVVVGASTVRAEGYFIPRRGVLAVVSRSGDFTGHQIRDTGSHGTLLILCPASAVERARETVGIADVVVVAVPDVDGSLPPDAIVASLRERGYRSIVVEGGPALATQFVVADAVDELCLTTSPVLNGAGVPLLGSHEFTGRSLTLEQLLLDDGGATYARWRLPA